jgi:hypothetical protein
MHLLPGRRARQLLIWLLIGASVIYASSASTLRMLGAPHWHAPAVATVPSGGGWDQAVAARLGHWLADLRGLADAMHLRAHALGVAPHQHSHHMVLRHWHADDDASVRLSTAASLSPELADLTAAAAIGGATLLLATGPDCAWRQPAPAHGAWPTVACGLWRSVRLPPPSEPPIV